MTNDLQTEIDFLKSRGIEQVTVAEMARRFEALGYRLNRSLDCFGRSRYMTGEHAGRSFPEITTGLTEIKTGRSAFHFESTRDDSFRAMMELRRNIFAVTRGAIFTV